MHLAAFGVFQLLDFVGGLYNLGRLDVDRLAGGRLVVDEALDGAFVAAPKVDVIDTTAAGDTLLAEYCFRFYSEKTADAGRWAVAAGSAACTMPGGAPPAMELVERLR